MASKPRGCFDKSLANHWDSPNRKRQKKGSSKRQKQADFKSAKRKKKIADLCAMPYDNYLNSPHWLRVRRIAISHHGGKCNRCGATSRIHVHHKTYARRGHEKMSDLELLCSDCHAGEHQHEKPWIEDSLTREFKVRFSGT